MGKRLSVEVIARMRVLATETGLGPTIISKRLGVPERTVYVWLKKFREEEGLCTTRKWQESD